MRTVNARSRQDAISDRETATRADAEGAEDTANARPGPEPERLKIDRDDWCDAVREVLRKGGDDPDEPAQDDSRAGP